MKVALLTLEPPLDGRKTCTGNQVRADHLKRGLLHHGHEVIQFWQSEAPDENTFDGPGALAGQLERQAHDAILVGYWELAEWLPGSLEVPVVIDCVAPRPLEFHFERPGETGGYIQRLIRVLGRADRVLCGNRRQRRLMLGWLLQAGIDLRPGTPVTVLPLSCDAERDVADRSAPEHWHLVSGGRNWPWRLSDRWLAELGRMAAEMPFSVHCSAPPDPPLPAGVSRSPLMSYDDWRGHLRTRAHIGLELADCNIEREFSQSFRAMACLEAGLPLMLNDYLELGRKVERFGAGWCVSDPEDAVSVMKSIIASPAEWQQARRGARELAKAFDFRSTVKPLAEWLDNPSKAERFGAGRPGAAPGHMAAKRPGPLSRVKSWLSGKLIRPFRRTVNGNGVVVVTRFDLFPTDHGAAVRIVETARALAGLGRPVAIVTADRNRYWAFEGTKIERRLLPAWLRWLAPPRSLVHLLHLLRGWPSNDAFLYWALWDPFYALRAAWVGRRIGAVIYMAEFPGYARACLWARNLNGGHVVMVEHNVEYRRIREQEPNLTDRQFQKLKTWELNLARACDAVVCVSREDQRCLAADGADTSRMLVIPHGVAVASLADAEPADVHRDYGLDPDLPVLVYHGTYRYPPNAEAIRILANEILPRLDQAGCKAQVLAIGSYPMAGLAYRHIRFTGSVNHLGPALRCAHIATVPLVQGGGTRMKILDYFAAGVPVVSTTKGCEGIPVADGTELLIRDNWDEFATAIMELLNNHEKSEMVRQAARRFVDDLDWGAIGERYDELIRMMCQNGK